MRQEIGGFKRGVEKALEHMRDSSDKRMLMAAGQWGKKWQEQNQPKQSRYENARKKSITLKTNF